MGILTHSIPLMTQFVNLATIAAKIAQHLELLTVQVAMLQQYLIDN